MTADYFAEPVQLNFKGNKKFNSLSGATVSIMLRIGVLIFAVTRMLSMISYQSQEIYSTISEQPIDEAVKLQEFNDFDFMLGFNRVFLADAG